VRQEVRQAWKTHVEQEGGTGIEQAGRALREDRWVRTGKGQAGKTFEENKRVVGREIGRQDYTRGQADSTEGQACRTGHSERTRGWGQEEGRQERHSKRTSVVLTGHRQAEAGRQV
jgi:hypothetical protein